MARLRHAFFLLALTTVCVARAQTPAAPTPSQPALREELLAMRAADQRARTANPIDPSKMIEVDTQHTARLKEIVATHGWPTKSSVGEDGALAAWLLAQHADRDRAFQESVLAMMEKLLPSGEAAPAHYAYLYDRTHRPQRYGTQGSCTGPGQWSPHELEDPQRVDELRAGVQMTPAALAEYIKIMDEACK